MRLLSTQGQGAAAYIAVAGWTRPASGNWAFGFECRIFSINSEQIILGNSGNNTSFFGVTTDGSLKYRDSGVDQILSDAGVIIPNTFYTFVFKRVGSFVELWLGPPGMKDDLVGGTKIGQTANLTQALFNPVNQFGRYYNSSTNTAIEIKRVWTVGGSYTDGWLPAGVHGTSTGWTSNSLSRFLTITNAAGATNSWWTQYPNASVVSKVGSGWPIAEVDYLTVFHWMQELKTSSVYVEAHCKGEAAPNSITTPTINAADFPVGCLIRGDVEYNGANHALLSTWARQIIVAANSGAVTVQDFALINTFAGAATANATNANKLKRLYIRQAGDPGSNNAVLMMSLDAVAENCVAICTLTTASKVIRPSDKGVIRNCVGIGATIALLSEWTSSKTEKSYGVGSSNLCCYWQNGRPAGNITNASEDGSGDVGYQNLSPLVNFVDYANGDYRIRASSPLHAAGIGAFFENSAYIGEGTITAAATVTTSLNCTKVGYSSVSAIASAMAASQGSKIGSAALSLPITAGIILSASKNTLASITVPMTAVLGIAANKVGVSHLYIDADADVSLYAGNIAIGEGTFSVTAMALASVQGEKIGQSPVHFAAAAAVYSSSNKQGASGATVSANAAIEAQASKTGQATPQLAVAAAMSADGYKVGLGSFAVLASATISVSGSNLAAVPAPVTLLFVHSSSRYTHSMRTSGRYSYNLKTSSGGASV